MKHLKFNKIKFIIFLFSIFSCNTVFSQVKKIEILYGISGWFDKNKRELPELENKIYLNNNIKLGYRVIPHLNIGISSNYYYDKYHSNSMHIILPDGGLFEEWIIKNKQIGFGPYIKFSVGNDFRLSLSSEFNYSFGVVNTISYVEWQEYTDKKTNKLNYTSKLFLFDINIGKKIYENLLINIFFKEQYVFVKDFSTKSSGIFKPYYQHYFGINLNYFFNIKNKQK